MNPVLSPLNERLERNPRIVAALLLLFCLILYGRIVGSGFFYVDDDLQILHNPFVHNAEMWSRIFSGSVWEFHGTAARSNFYRPLQVFSYWLIYRWAGPNAGAFHIASLAFFAATVWLVYAIGARLLGNHVAAFAGALLWMVHPLHVEVVAWNSALPDAGAGFFYLLAFWLFLRAEQAATPRFARHVLGAIAFLPALFFKESAVTLPLLLVAYWFFVGGRGTWRERAVHAAPYLLAAGLYLFVRVSVLGHLTDARDSFSATVFSAAVGLLGEHFRLFFWPHPLGLFRTFHTARSLLSPWPWAALAMLGAALLARRRAPVLGFFAAWWVAVLAVALDIRQLTFPFVADRFSYVPSVGFCLAIAWLAFVWAPQQGAAARPVRVVVPGVLILLCVWGIITVRTLPYWEAGSYSELVLADLKKFPDSPILHKLWAGTLLFDGKLDEAAREFQLAIDLNYSSVRPGASILYDGYVGLGQVELRRGHMAAGLRYLEQAARVMPGDHMAYLLLGANYFARRDYARASEYFQNAVRTKPMELSARFYLGTCWMQLGKYREAAAQFHAAVEVDPSYEEAWAAEARALEAAGDADGAARARALAKAAMERQ